MPQIDINNGKLYLEDGLFPLSISADNIKSHTIGKDEYENITSSVSIVGGFPFIATAFFKNKKLRSIQLIITNEYFKKNYQLDSEFDFRDYITPYIDYCKLQTNALIELLTRTKKRRFQWGKIEALVDPRIPTVFAEIKYY